MIASVQPDFAAGGLQTLDVVFGGVRAGDDQYRSVGRGPHELRGVPQLSLPVENDASRGANAGRPGGEQRIVGLHGASANENPVHSPPQPMHPGPRFFPGNPAARLTVLKQCLERVLASGRRDEFIKTATELETAYALSANAVRLTVS